MRPLQFPSLDLGDSNTGVVAIVSLSLASSFSSPRDAAVNPIITAPTTTSASEAIVRGSDDNDDDDVEADAHTTPSTKTPEHSKKKKKNTTIRYRCRLAYDGTHFVGFQRQGGSGGKKGVG